MKIRLGKWIGISILSGLGVCALLAQTNPARSRASSDPPSGERIVRFVRDRFAIPDSVTLTISPFRPSADPDYNEATVTVFDGKQTTSRNVSVSKNGRYLAMGSMLALQGDPRPEIVRYARDVFKIPQNIEVTAGPLQNAGLTNFNETLVTVDDGKRKQSFSSYVTKDNRFAVLGDVLPILTAGEVERIISLKNQPSTGGAHARVTVVEYADLECPTCARLHEYLEREFLPKYGDRVKVVFKEFPLVHHDWAMTAAIASQCAYQTNPSAFLTYRSLIFQHQTSISAANVRDALIQYAEEAGIERVKLAACIDSKASLARVEESVREAKALGVTSTPSTFINGRMVVGAGPEEFQRTIEQALAGSAGRTH